MEAAFPSETFTAIAQITSPHISKDGIFEKHVEIFQKRRP